VETKTVTIHASNGNFDVDGAIGLDVNDEVKFVVTGEGGTHGIRVFSPEGAVLFTLDPLGATPSERTITLTAPGSYQFICTRPTCSSGHSEMSGAFIVGPEGSPGSGDGY
jgi:heme/copper-type cytochrome/quinol oxidase subunit 2